jgi:hypothetical protein
MIEYVHKWLDARPGVETNVYERRMVWLRELLLLVATLGASLSFADLRSWIPALVGAFGAAVQCEDRRVIGSVGGRHVERGNEAPPLPEHKAALVAGAKTREPFWVWGWPLLSAILAAGYARSVTWTLVVALVAGYVRAAYDSRWFPAWRKSRVKWSAARRDRA